MEKIRQEIKFLCTGLLCDVKLGASGNGSEEMLDHIFSELKENPVAEQVYAPLFFEKDAKVRFEAARRCLMLGVNITEAKKELMMLAKFNSNPILRYNAETVLGELQHSERK